MLFLSLAIATMGFTACSSGDDDEPWNIPGQGNGQGGNTGFTPERIVDVSQAGTLPEKISEADMYKIRSLRLTGVLNGTDILFLRKMAGSDEQGNATGGILENLDISDTKIVSGGEVYYGQYQCVTNYDKIGTNMFYKLSSLKTILLPNDVTAIGTGAFEDCSNLTFINIPEGVTSIGNSAFMGCSSLTSIDLPKDIISIGAFAFCGCSSLTSIVIPSKIQEINLSAFSEENTINSIYMKSENPPIRVTGPIDRLKITLYVPRGALNNYKSWKRYFTDILEYDL